MPKLKLGAEGQLVDDEGNPYLVGDEPIEVVGAQTTEAFEAALKDRLARQKDKIAALEAQANRNPELEELLKAEKKSKAELEEQLGRAQADAEAKVAGQLDAEKKRAKDLEEHLYREREGRVKDQVTTLILSKAGSEFIDPASDIVPRLLSAHKREPIMKDGKPVEGQSQDLFRMSWKDEKNEEHDELVPIEKAIEIIKGQPQFRHYLKASGNGGSGGGDYSIHGNLKRSQMTEQQKSDFVRKRGLAEYKKLPE